MWSGGSAERLNCCKLIVDMEEVEAARLTRKFALVDASFGFLARHRAVLSVKNVLRMACSLGGASGEAVTRAELREMAVVAPALLRIEATTGREVQHKGEEGGEAVVFGPH
jgi:hypothetical protein